MSSSRAEHQSSQLRAYYVWEENDNYEMESVRTLNHHSHTKTALRKSFTPVINGFLFPLTLTIPKKPKLFSSLRLSVGSSSSRQDSSTEHTTLLVETFHEHRKFKTLLKRLSKNDSCPMRLLREDGDWSKEHFWAVVRFLRHGSRTKEIVQVLFLVFALYLFVLCSLRF